MLKWRLHSMFSSHQKCLFPSCPRLNALPQPRAINHQPAFPRIHVNHSMLSQYKKKLGGMIVCRFCPVMAAETLLSSLGSFLIACHWVERSRLLCLSFGFLPKMSIYLVAASARMLVKETMVWEMFFIKGNSKNSRNTRRRNTKQVVITVVV